MLIHISVNFFFFKFPELSHAIFVPQLHVLFAVSQNIVIHKVLPHPSSVGCYSIPGHFTQWVCSKNSDDSIIASVTGDEVGGVSVSIRDRDNIVQLWNVRSDLADQSTIVDKIKKLLQKVNFSAIFYKGLSLIQKVT